MADELSKLRQELEAGLRITHLMLHEHVKETDRRFTETGQRLNEMGEMLVREAAESRERWNQIFGRMRLMDGRIPPAPDPPPA